MRFKSSVPLFVLLSGCIEPIPAAPPSEAVLQLRAACSAGETHACTTLAQLEQRERERISAIPRPVYNATYIDPEPFMRKPSQQVICNPGFGGQVICTSN